MYVLFVCSELCVGFYVKPPSCVGVVGVGFIKGCRGGMRFIPHPIDKDIAWYLVMRLKPVPSPVEKRRGKINKAELTAVRMPHSLVAQRWRKNKRKGGDQVWNWTR